MAPGVDIQAFATSQLTLLDKELQAEREETALLTAGAAPITLQRAGLALLNLHVSAQRTGLGGKTILELGLDSAIGSGDLPEHGLRVGDIVAVAEQPKGGERKKEKEGMKLKGVDGVVTKVRRENVSVALDKEDAEAPAGSGRLWLVKLANDITYKRMNQTMTRLQKLTDAETTPLMRVLFGQSTPTPIPKDLSDPELGVGQVEWIDPGLNDSQKDAIKFALASREIALIHGPPGTGKTYTLIELILQMLKRNLRLLVCGPSNISVDNIVERLAPHKVPMIRLGHPARLLPSVVDHSLDVLTRTSDDAAIVQDIRKEMDSKQASIRKTRNARERKAIYNDLRELRKDYRDRERGCIGNLITGSKVVLATLHGAGAFHLKDQKFDAVIIDEASQALEAQCWVPLLSASKAILAGDHLQLPPTIKSSNTKTKANKAKGGEEEKPAAAGGKSASLETTLFDRLLDLYGPSIKRMLTVQYRMHEKINEFPSKELYEGKLVAADAVKSRLLVGLPYEVKETDDTVAPVVFWDTQGGDFPEKPEDDDVDRKAAKGATLAESKSNEHEAMLVQQHVQCLVEAGVKSEDIGVLSPYAAQLSILSQLLKEAYPGIELGTVDGFQGREKEAIVVSLVRSNDEREVGFLGEKRRLNVAMTRARRHLCIIGDSETVSRGSPFLRRWVAFLEAHADLRFAAS